ncbi:MAG: hypothetical protein R3B70_47700 [Polyangiaceae bacterium]
MRILELLGFAGGALFAPIAAAGSFLRQARVFHPDGVVYRAVVTVDAQDGPAKEVAARLAGPALVRLSSALWKTSGGRARRPDLLGLAIRFRHDPTVSVIAEQGDQDLLFATMRSLLTFIPALFTTNVHSFLADDYYAVGLFDAAELGEVKWRLITPRIPGGEISRVEALEQAVLSGVAIFELQARDARAFAEYQPVARIRLVERVDVDQSALRFSPFRSGRGIVPRGFVNALRIVPYPASQLARAAWK